MSGSALNVLNEEMQLTSEISGLELLLEGALSDRFVRDQRLIKPRATIGFPITLIPQDRYRNAVAVVEVEVENAKLSLDPADPPAITALLPREKTYNVAALVDSTKSFGAGAVIGTVGVSGSFLSGTKTYYVVQDQDTVAIERPLADRNNPRTKSFAWEFRPVLGNDFVRGGMTQTFVQLSFPVLRPNMPLPESKPTPPKIGLDSPVIQNTDEMVVPMDKASEVKSVKMGETSVQFEYTKGKAFIRLKNLRRDGVTTEQRTRELTFVFKDGTKATAKLEVVAARVGVKQGS